MSKICVRTDRPATKASPPVGERSPVSTESAVVLPAPLGPSSAKQPCPSIASDRSSRAILGGCRFPPFLGILNVLRSRTIRMSDPSASPDSTLRRSSATSGSSALAGDGGRLEEREGWK
eukprot:scaffold329902_cov67-Tisochrysis_lutea.AAC.1